MKRTSSAIAVLALGAGASAGIRADAQDLHRLYEDLGQVQGTGFGINGEVAASVRESARRSISNG